jgi:hypothetical protein
MAAHLYCWKCDRDVPMLDESEWAQLEPALAAATEEIQSRRARMGLSLSDALSTPYGRRALILHEQLTGELATAVEPLWHHRASLYGPPCPVCSRPLRTPRAQMCVSCGAARA